MKLLLNVLSLIAHFVTHIHPLLHINTSELPSTASLCVVVAVMMKVTLKPHCSSCSVIECLAQEMLSHDESDDGEV